MFLALPLRLYTRAMAHVMDRPLTLDWWRKPRARAAFMGGGAALAVLLLIALLWGARERSFSISASAVTIATVGNDVFHDFVPLRGTVVPKDTIYLDALEGGQVEKVLAQAGDQVVQGQPLVTFRNAQLQLDVLNNEGRLVESITQLQSFETQLEANRVGNAKTLADIHFNIASLEHTAARYDPLKAAGAISSKDVEAVHDQLDHYRALLPLQVETNKRQEALRLAQLPGLQSELLGLKKSLQVTRDKLEDLTVKAPVTGRITALDLKIGENRNRGERLAEIVPPTGFKIAADIDEYYLARTRAGQTADVELNGKTYRLKLARVYPQVKGGIFTADFFFQDAMPADLTTGAAAEGKLTLGGDRQAVILPAGPFLEASGGDYVFVVDGGSAHRRRVKLGRRNVMQVEVLSGLKPGERVITSDYAGYDKIDR
ncbi:MAG TPA: HlyD family efflux transporter periplasmic adaptor subunit, partial [Rhizomicrobium sp.]|nr:HlyD family efflux transporter periplasmic adaptor subunit [Rhizomicrobium sp.]